MFADIDLEALAQRRGAVRAYLSVYLARPEDWQTLRHRADGVRAVLSDDEDELSHFEENFRLVSEHIEGRKFAAESLCVFCAWADDWLVSYDLEEKTSNLLWAGSAPFLRPLEELKDEFENFVAVIADNKDAHIYFVSSAVPAEEERVKGGIKNRVKKGGWSQKRYARRRDKQLHHYADEIEQALGELKREKKFDRIILVGSQETLHEIHQALPHAMKDMVVESEAVDLNDENGTWDEIWRLFDEEERRAEESLWNQIRTAYAEHGPAATGFDAVLKAVLVGRVQAIIVDRNAAARGSRCRACENTFAKPHAKCPACKESDLFEIDLVNELTLMAEQTSARVEFTDPIPGLTKAGGVAALLRY